MSMEDKITEMQNRLVVMERLITEQQQMISELHRLLLPKPKDININKDEKSDDIARYRAKILSKDKLKRKGIKHN